MSKRAWPSPQPRLCLAHLRYAGGNTSYLEVLTTDTDLYNAPVDLAQAQAQDANSLVQLYAALVGGWR
jgi:outer membrane protein, multidrug efflux system